jgi:DNA modification methylase
VATSNARLLVEWVEIGRVFCSPSNPRQNDQAVDAVAASLRRFGFQQPLVAKPSGEVIAGNTRLKAATSLGLGQVPVVWFEGSDLEATAYAIADNRTHEFAQWDDVALARLLVELRSEDALDGVGYDDADIDALLAELGAHDSADLEDAGAQEPPAVARTRRGDLWVLGTHRLLCGDSTSAADMARLMAGETATLLATDPPYLVDYDGTNHPAEHHRKAGRKAPAGKEVGNRHWDAYIDPDSSVEFFASFLEVALAHCTERAPIYQWHATRRQALVEAAWRQNGLLVHQTIVWAKSRGVLTRSHYLWQHEPCFYGWREGMQPERERRPATTLTTVWELDSESDGIHPTQKPLRVFEIPIESHTRPGEVCLEPFSGSGTQLVAAERLGRRCFAMELSPAFVDAAVLRWQKSTGKTAVLDGTGEAFDAREPATTAAERGLEAS